VVVFTVSAGVRCRICVYPYERQVKETGGEKQFQRERKKKTPAEHAAALFAILQRYRTTLERKKKEWGRGKTQA